MGSDDLSPPTDELEETFDPPRLVAVRAGRCGGSDGQRGGSGASGGSMCDAGARICAPSGSSITGRRSSNVSTVTVNAPCDACPAGTLCPSSSSFGAWPASKCQPFGGS